jgi:hypothetical protein
MREPAKCKRLFFDNGNRIMQIHCGANESSDARIAAYYLVAAVLLNSTQR